MIFFKSSGQCLIKLTDVKAFVKQLTPLLTRY